MILQVKRLRPSAILPCRGTPHSSGLDIFTDIHITIYPGKDYLYPTGLAFNIPEGYDLSVYNKSGVCTKKKLIKGAELIDFDYTGEVHIHLFNLSDDEQRFEPKQKIAQLVLRPVMYPDIQEVETIEKITDRGSGGFGSTGN